jgi:selenocysteine-specific elongation factor
MFVIATAGHVDHGKSTLVRALTGINPDRLREEQEREMTIDLGFAWMTLPNGEPVGIVDVPGHIDFIENMLAGVGGIHAALLVIAADEGPMPQTREHLAILNLLRVPRAVVALTKADLAPDAEWLDLVSADIRRLLAPTTLAGAPIVPVSARTGHGLPELMAALQTVVLETRFLEESGFLARRDRGRARLPVDRVFSIAGFGTVATGTLADGSFAIGDEVEVLPQGIRARVRGLQTHKQKLERAQPGSRVAMNLSGVSVEQVARGSVIARPDVLRPSTLLDVQLDLLAAPFLRAALRHNSEIKFFSGTAESVARARLLEGDELAPGTQGWAQLELARPMVLAPGDRFIARLPSPSVTIGGGVVVDPHPAQRHRRRAGRADDAVLARLSALLQGTPAERLESALRRLGFTSRAEAVKQSGLPAEEFETAFGELAAAGALLQVDDVVAPADMWQAKLDALVQLLAAFHAAQPLAMGMPRESARSKLQLAPRIFNALVHRSAETGAAVDEGEAVRLSSHQVRFNAEQQRAVDALLAQCRAQPFNTPLVKDCRAAVGDAVYEVLLRQGRLVQVSPEVVFLRETYEAAVQRIRELIQQNGQITAAQVRDAYNTSRKYALALLEYLDAQNITRRVGDARVLAK